MSPCKHQRWERVESVVDGEHLATICADCLRSLPLDYEGDVERIVVTVGGEVVMYAPVSP